MQKNHFFPFSFSHQFILYKKIVSLIFSLAFFLRIVLFYCFILLQQHLFAMQVDNVQELKNYIHNEYKRVYPEISISSISLIARTSLDLYNIEIIDKSINSYKGASGYLALSYKYGNKVLQENIRYTMNAQIKLYVASENIRAMSNFHENNLIERIQDFSTLSIAPASKKEILNSSAKAYIPIHTIIYKNKLAKKILILKDSNVKILFKQDGIEASMLGRALENGMQGEIIKVENLESKKILNAEVVADGVVQIR